MRGRLKTTGEHMRDGTYENCRHANRLDAGEMPGTPERPRGLNPSGRWLWDQVTTGLPLQVLGQIDTAALKAACELWQVWTKHKGSAEPRELRLGMAALKQAQEILKQFGWTPGDRAKIKSPPAKTDAAAAKFFKVIS